MIICVAIRAERGVKYQVRLLHVRSWSREIPRRDSCGRAEHGLGWTLMGLIHDLSGAKAAGVMLLFESGINALRAILNHP